jgi:nicotinate-nucleotide adenylyltransferase
MPTLCFGGSFNPIHNGHLICAQAVAEKAGYDRVLLIPSAVPPHKTTADLASAADRLAMCRLAAEERAGATAGLFAVSDIETRRTGPSYTIDTAHELLSLGLPRVDWLIGADMLLHLPEWHRPLDLLREVHFVVMARPRWAIDWNALPMEFQHLRDNVVQAPKIDISATDVRRRVREGLPIAGLVPETVGRFIRSHHLFAPTAR